MFATSENYFQLSKSRIQEKDWSSNNYSVRRPLHTKKKMLVDFTQTLIFFIFILQFKVCEFKNKQRVRTVLLTKHGQ